MLGIDSYNQTDLYEHVAIALSTHRKRIDELPIEKRLELIGLYLQGCFGDFIGWKIVPQDHWQQLVIHHNLQNLALSAEKYWKDNFGLPSHQAQNIFCDRLLNY